MPALQIADLNNAKTDVDHIAAFANSASLTATDRLGSTKRTLAGVLADFDEATDAAEALMDAATGEVATAAATATTKATEAAASAAAAAISEAQAAAIVFGDFLQSGTGAVARTFTSKVREWVSVKDFGAVGDGLSHPLSEFYGSLADAQVDYPHAVALTEEIDRIALQAAATSLVATGGVVLVPPGRYRHDKQVTVSSLYPISLMALFAGNQYTPSIAAPGLIICDNIAGSMIKFESPDGNRVHNGGGRVSGLMFYDATGSGGDPGTYTCTAALDLHDFGLSSVDDCVFQWINGSAIRGDFVVMSSIKSNRIRYCGAVGKPALYFPGTDPDYTTQSTDIAFNKVEVCHGAEYLHMGSHTADCKVLFNGFEADVANAGSNQKFGVIAGTAHSIGDNHFNRNTGIQLTLSATGCTVTANKFRGGAYVPTAFEVTGDHNDLGGNIFRSARLGFEVDISGVGNALHDSKMFSSGAVRTRARGNKVRANYVQDCSALAANLGAGNEWWIQEHSDGTSSTADLSDNTLVHTGGGVTDTGGMRVYGTGTKANGNQFHGFAGTGSGAVCLRKESEFALVALNTETGSTTLLVDTTIGNSDHLGNWAMNGGTVLPLTGTVSHAGGAIADGAIVTYDIAISGAAMGDYVKVSYTQPLEDVDLSARVEGAGVVRAKLHNRTGGSESLVAGVIEVVVSKR